MLVVLDNIDEFLRTSFEKWLRDLLKGDRALRFITTATTKQSFQYIQKGIKYFKLGPLQPFETVNLIMSLTQRQLQQSEIVSTIDQHALKNERLQLEKKVEMLKNNPRNINEFVKRL